jgi:inorganic pyrophosphatase
MSHDSINRLPAFDDDGAANVIVETPQGSCNKFDFDPETRLFELGTAMPAGASFPFEFGFIPSTRGEDGDPLDILLLMDNPTFVGCLVKVRLIGVIEAEQSERDGKFVRNDRLIGVAVKSRRHEGLRSLRHLAPQLLAEIEHFFAAYNQVKGRQFKVLGRFGHKRAAKLVMRGIKKARRR